MKGMDETEMLEALPIRLRQDVQYFLNRDLIANLPLLHGMDDRIVLTVSQRLRREVSPSLLASAGVTVWSRNEGRDLVRGYLGDAEVKFWWVWGVAYARRFVCLATRLCAKVTWEKRCTSSARGVPSCRCTHVVPSISRV
jgi:hypothetical protein